MDIFPFSKEELFAGPHLIGSSIGFHPQNQYTVLFKSKLTLDSQSVRELRIKLRSDSILDFCVVILNT